MNIRRSSTVFHHPRAGLSLLEVLVACGVLAIGLASVAAMLPAASSRFGQAQQADRAGFLAANARADLLNRGLVAADVLLSGTPAPVTLPRAFGQVATALLTINSSATGAAGRTWPNFISQTGTSGTNQTLNTGTTFLAQRIDTVGDGRGFLLEDDLEYLPPSGAETPRNSFLISGTAGPRLFDQSMRWGATLWPAGTTTGTAARGTPALLSVAVFRRPGDACEMLLQGSGSASGPTTLQCTGVLRPGVSGSMQSGTSAAVAIEGGRRQYLAACSFVLALTNPPQWARVASSWTIPGLVVQSGTVVTGTENPFLRRSFVVLEPAPQFTGTTVRVVGFNGLLRLDQHPVTLE